MGNGQLVDPPNIPTLMLRLSELELAEADFRLCCERDGAASMTSGRAWDHMRKAGDRARQLLARLT